jgi:peptide/nickel transport system substrate-binding protein
MTRKLFYSILFLFSLWAFFKLHPAQFFNREEKEEQVVYLCTQEAQTLDPSRACDYASARVTANLYEGLVKFRPGSLEIEPALAKEWEISADGLTWTFHLRPGVTFHDGTPFNAQAVKFNVDRLLNKKDAYGQLVYGMVEAVEATDELTVRFRLKFPYAPFLNNLALFFAAPVISPEAVKKYGDGLATHPVGTGPFFLEKWEKGKEIILAANPSYWGTKPAAGRIVFRLESDSRKRTALLLNGRADVIDASPEEIPSLSAKGCQIWRITGPDVSYLGFYTNKKPFSDAAVRQAACRAIDNERLVRELFGNMAVPASGPLPPDTLGYDAAIRQPSPNLKEARRLLAGAGYPDGLPITIITYEGERPYNPAGGEALARELAGQLAGAGFQVKVFTYPWEEFKKALYRQEGDAFLYGWTADNRDPDNFLFTLFSSAQIPTGLNATRYSRQKTDTLLVTAQRTLDPTLRARLYQDVLNELRQDTPAFFINHSLFLLAASPALQNLQVYPGGVPLFQNVKK